MKGYSWSEILNSIVGFLCLGVGGGLFPLCADTVLSVLHGIPGAVISAWRKTDLRHGTKRPSVRIRPLSAKRPVRDFLGALLTGIGYCFVCYLTLDGAMRLYGIIPFAAARFLTGRIAERFVKPWLMRVSALSETVLTQVLTAALFPVRLLLMPLTAVAGPVHRGVRTYVLQRKKRSQWAKCFKTPRKKGKNVERKKDLFAILPHKSTEAALYNEKKRKPKAKST